MTREDLFHAIGEAEESRLAHSEIMGSSNVFALEEGNGKHKKRIPLRFALIAAIVACLAFSALASERYLSGYIEGGMQKYTFRHLDGRLEEREGFEWGIYLDVEVIEPIWALEEFYIPKAMNDEVVGAYSWTDDRIYGFTIVEKNREDMLQFKQWGIFHYEPGRPVYSLMGTPEYEPTSSIIQWGNQEYMLVEDGSVCYLFWSDGRYLFYLRFNDYMDMDRVREIVESLTPVDSLEPYMWTP